MKAKLFVLFTFLFHVSFAQNWNFIGSTSGINSASEVDLEISNSGTPYIAYVDPTNSGKISVKKWINNAWTFVGNNGFSGPNSFDIQLILTGETPIVACKHNTGGSNNNEIIEVYTYTGSNWGLINQNLLLFTDHDKDYATHLAANNDVILTYTNLGQDFITGLITINLNSGTQLGNQTEPLDENQPHQKAISSFRKTGSSDNYVFYDADMDMYSGINRSKVEATSNTPPLAVVEEINPVKIITKGALFSIPQLMYNLTYSYMLNSKNYLEFNISSNATYTPNPMKIDSSANNIPFDYCHTNNYNTFFYKNATGAVYKRLSFSGSTVQQTIVSTGTSLAPNSFTCPQVSIYNNLEVIAYIYNNKVYVKELDLPGNVEDWDDFRACEGTSFNSSNSNNEIYILDPNYSTANVTLDVTSENPSIIPNSGINTSSTSSSDIFVLTISTINDVSTPTTVDLVVKYMANGVAQNTRIIPFVVNPKPDITFVAPINNLCKNAPAVNISSWANPVGGTWMGLGVTNNQFHPAVTTGNLANLTYTKTNQYGCTNSADFPITINAVPQLSTTTTASECDENTGTATVSIYSGVMPYTTYWSSGSTSHLATNLAPGHYVVTVADANGCVSTSNAMVPSIGLSQSGQITHLTCPNDQNGSIDVTPTGGVGNLTYLWSNGATTADISGLEAGAYDLTIKDSEGCISTATYTVEQPTPFFLIAETKTNAACEQSNGSITVSYSGGVAPLTYTWTNSDDIEVSSSNQLTNAEAGMYLCTTTDANACEHLSFHYINNASGPILAIDTIIHSSCSNDGSIELELVSGSVDSYLWSTGATTAILTNVGPDQYAVQVTDTNGCITVVTGEIEALQPQPVDICLVTVDENTNKNMVVWEKPATNTIDHFNIYRETSQAGNYQLVGSVDYADESIFTDIVASPNVRSWRYKIASADACGVEASLSENHKTIHLVISQGLGNDINLFWDKYEGFAYSEFVLKRHTTAGGWETLTTMPTNLFTYTDQPTNTDGLMYMVTVDAPNTCSSTKMAQDFNTTRSNRDNRLSTNTTNAISEILNQVVSIYPNPVTEVLHVNNNSSQLIEARILDQTGRIISTTTLVPGQTKIDCGKLAIGVYNIELHSLGAKTLKRFTIEK